MGSYDEWNGGIMKYYYLYSNHLEQPVNCKYLPNKLALYTNFDSAKRGKAQYDRYHKAQEKAEIKEIEI